MIDNIVKFKIKELNEQNFKEADVKNINSNQSKNKILFSERADNGAL